MPRSQSDMHDVQTPVYTEARENIHQTITTIRRLVQNRRGPLGIQNCAWGYRIPFVNQSPLAIYGLHTNYSQEWWVFSQSVLRPAEQLSCTASSTLPSQLQPSVVTKATGSGSRYNIFPTSMPSCSEALRYGNTSVNPRALQKGQWLTSLYLKGPYFHIGIHPANIHSLRFCQNGTAWQFTVLSCGLSISPRVFTKILKPVLTCVKNTHLHVHAHGVKLHTCNWTTQRIIIIELI